MTHYGPGQADLHMARRHLLKSGLAAGLIGSALPSAALAADGVGSGGLDGIARARKIRFGSAVNWAPAGRDSGSFANPAYAALLRADCGLLVAENEMKWQTLRPAGDRFDTSRFDAIIAWSDPLGFRMRGHTLLWHYHRWFPAWLNNQDFGPQPGKAAEAILTSHIETITKRYGTRIYSYDVVNEAVDPDTAGLRQTSLSKAMGSAEAVLDHCFHTARAAAPHAELVYNDYMSWEVGNEKHRDGVLRLLEGFRKRGVPVDTLGVQSHIGIFQPVRSIPELVETLTPAWRQFLDAVTGMGYRLAITEFDVRDRGLPADIPTRDRGVAEFARAYLDLMLAYPQLTDVLVWGMSDRFSWLRGFEPRPDGELTRGNPYDVDLRRKPLHAAFAAAFAAAPMRKPGPSMAGAPAA